MEKADLLKPFDSVNVIIWGPDDSRLYEIKNTGFHTIEEAIRSAVDGANLNISPEDCVFEVNNETTGVTHKYRYNAHGHIKLII